MKNHRRTIIWILLTIVLVSLGLSICALVVANSDVRGDCEMVYDYTKLLELTGIVFSIVGVVWTVYFVIAGINVINIQKIVQSESENITKYKAELETHLKSFTKDLYSIYQSLFIIVNDLGQSIPSSKERNQNIEKAKKDLQLIKARMGTKLRYLPEKDRIEDIKYLLEKGGKLDFEDINKIIEDPSENKLIKDSIIHIQNIKKQTSQEKTSLHKVGVRELWSKFLNLFRK